MVEYSSNDELVEAIYTFAAEQMQQRVPYGEIRSHLTSRGLDNELASIVIRNVLQANSSATKALGKSNMVYGALWCLGGVAVQSLRSGALNSGITTLLIWGAIVFGGFSFARGFFQWMKG